MQKFVMAILAVLLVSAAGLAQDVQTGRWTLNVGKSQFKTSAAPKTQIVTIASEGKDGLKVMADVVRANGAKAAFVTAMTFPGVPPMLYAYSMISEGLVAADSNISAP